jgi:hypothetical protein
LTLITYAIQKKKRKKNTQPFARLASTLLYRFFLRLPLFKFPLASSQVSLPTSRGLPTLLADATRTCLSIPVAHVMQLDTSQVGLCTESYRCRRRVLPYIASLEPLSYVPLLSLDQNRPESPPAALVPAWLVTFVTILFHAFSHIPSWEHASTLFYIFILPI